MRRASLALLLCLTVTACGSGDGAADPPSTDAGATTTAAFPVTIRHHFGSATIAGPPKRVVSLSNVAGDLDPLIAVGVMPVAASRDQLDPSGVFPWLRGRLSPARTKLLDTGTGIGLEQVAALRPDAILATGYAKVAGSIAKLESIAPTATFATSWYRQTWQDETRLVGRAVGRGPQADRAVADTERQLARVLDEHPRLRGRTFSMSLAFQPGGVITIRDPDEKSSKLLGQVGLRLAPAVQRVPKFSAGNDGGAVSDERLDVLDADVVIVAYATPQLRRATESNPLFRRIPAVRDGRYVAVDMETITQLRDPSVLGIPWAMRRLEPALAKAAG